MAHISIKELKAKDFKMRTNAIISITNSKEQIIVVNAYHYDDTILIELIAFDRQNLS